MGFFILAAVACGGKAVIDEPGGGGGLGGTTSWTTTTWTTTSSWTTTSTGTWTTTTGCDCGAFCGTLQGCGLVGPECMALCGNASPSTVNCVCNAGSCAAAGSCLGIGGSGAGGGAITPACENCANNVVLGPGCENQLLACQNNVACTDLAECASGCDWTYQCVDQCNAIHPQGIGPLSALLSCSVCVSCWNQCASTGLTMYCLDGF